MAGIASPPGAKQSGAKAEEEPPEIEPLTRRDYKRLPAVQAQIEMAASLGTAALAERARERRKEAPGHMSPEALAYFVRRAHRNDDRKARELLFRELLERCTPFFRGKFRGFDKEIAEDLQGHVLKGLIEDLLAADDRGDFTQVRFWTYLERRVIDACRTAFRHAEETESLDTGYSGDGESDGRTKLEAQADKRLTPEELAILSEALATLPPRLRHVFLFRHAIGMQIGTDDPDDNSDEVTMARHFGCTGRTIRNWLREADELLAGFREKHNERK
jgi:DNA-directed RNA polymerase specialized sigma24 family protein